MPRFSTNNTATAAVRLTPKQKKVLREYLLHSGRSLDEIVNEAMDAYIECSLIPRLRFYEKR